MFKLKKVTGGGTKLIVNSKKSDYVSFSLYVGVGQKDNVKYDQTAHLLEHMIAKNCNELFDEAIEYGAETWNDHTKYYFKSKKEDFIQHLNLFIDNLVDFAFDETSFEREKKVIDVEMNSVRNQTIPLEAQIEEFVYDSNYISNMEIEYPTLFLTKDISKTYLMVFFNKHYTADNMVVSLQTDDESIVKYVEEYLEKLTKLKKIISPFESTQQQEELKVFFSPLKNYHVIQNKSADSQVTFKIPSVSQKHKLFSASLLYSKYLTENQLCSVLLNELRSKRGLVYYTLSEITSEKNLNFLEITYKTFAKNVKQVNGIIRRVMDSIAKNGISRAEFEKLKRNYIKKCEFSLDNESESYLDDVCVKLLNSDRTRDIGLNRADYIDWVKNTTIEDFNNYAKHISKIKNYFILGSGKNMSKKDLERFKSSRQKDYKNDYYYENMLTQGEKTEYIKTLQEDYLSLSKAERDLVESKKFTKKGEQEKEQER